MRGEVNKRHNRKIRKPCPVCGGKVIIAHRNAWWWIRCDADPHHIPFEPFQEPIDAIRWFQPKTNADRIRAMTDEELAEWCTTMIQDCDCNSFPCKMFCDKTNNCKESWLSWLKQECE